MRHFSILSLTVCLTVVLFCGAVSAQVRFIVTETPDKFTDPNPIPWQARFETTILFETEAENILLADEVDELPGLNSHGLGRDTGTLTFGMSSTNLPFSFSITADGTLHALGDPGAGFTYNDDEGPEMFQSGALSPGDISNFENDDVSFRFFDGDDIFGFGFDLLDSNVSNGETLSVYDQNDMLLASFDLPPGPYDDDGVRIINNFFLGVTSTVPIGRITFDENAGSDDIAIRDFRFSTDQATVPEPSGFAFAAIMLLAAASRRRK